MSTTIKSFFGIQKRDLNDKSNEDDETKKAKKKESSLNVSLSKYDTDIFEEDIESPLCAGILTAACKIWKKRQTRFLSFLSQ